MAEGFGSSEQCPFPLRSSPVVTEHRSTQGERKHSASPILAAPGQGRGDCIWGEYSPNGFKRGGCPTKAIPMEVWRIGSWARFDMVVQ